MPFAPDVATLLRDHGITGAETPIAAHDGQSGAPLSTIECDGKRYFLKRIGAANDWIARTTEDTHGREAQFAASDLVARLPKDIGMPSLGAAHDGAGWAILMRDIAPYLIPDDGSLLASEVLDDVLIRIAEMHATFWQADLEDAGINWTAPEPRLRLLSPERAAALEREGIDVGAGRSWRAFNERASADAASLARRLFVDMSGLIAAIESSPKTLVHGDLRLANMGIGEGKLWLFDWAMVTRTAVSFEMGWFLAVNSSRLPWRLADVYDRYCEHLKSSLDAQIVSDHECERSRALMFLTGFLLFIWGKANIDARGQTNELQWWCDGAIDGAKLLGL